MSAAGKPRASRHSWVKIRIHVYICQKCGTGQVNEATRNGWISTFHTPDGKSSPAKHVPPCEAGPKTAAALKKHESAIVVWNAEKAATKASAAGAEATA